MFTIGDRLRILRTKLLPARYPSIYPKAVTQDKFCSLANLSRNTIINMENDVTKAANSKNIELICNAFKVSKEWLVNGEEPVFIDDLHAGNDVNLEYLINIYKNLPPALQEYLIEQARELARLSKKSIPFD